MTTRIMVLVEDGTITAVLSSDPNVEADVLNWDDVDEARRNRGAPFSAARLALARRIRRWKRGPWRDIPF